FSISFCLLIRGAENLFAVDGGIRDVNKYSDVKFDKCELWGLADSDVGLCRGRQLTAATHHRERCKPESLPGVHSDAPAPAQAPHRKGPSHCATLPDSLWLRLCSGWTIVPRLFLRPSAMPAAARDIRDSGSPPPARQKPRGTPVAPHA